MEWRDEGIILSVRRHGETSAIADILTAEHGRSLGLVRGGDRAPSARCCSPETRFRRPGGRGLKSISATSLLSRAPQGGAIMDEPFRLSGLSTLAGLAQLLPEREPHQRIYDALLVVLEAIDNDEDVAGAAGALGMGLLDELGFGLDLSKCAVDRHERKSRSMSHRGRDARSVPRQASPIATSFSCLPPFLAAQAAAPVEDILAGFDLTGYFLDRHLFDPRGLAMPEPRGWIIRTLAQRPH